MNSRSPREKLALAKAGRCAEEILQEHSIKSFPIDLVALAKKEDIACHPAKFTGCSGCLICEADAFTLLFRDDYTTGFQRFTIAHELGHYFLDGHVQLLFPQGGGEHRSALNYRGKPLHEREADEFAANLLMPRDQFASALGGKTGRGLPAIEELAAHFQTSLTSTAIRYAQLCDVEVAIIVSSGEEVDYCFLSESMKRICPTWSLKGHPVPSMSTTHEFNRAESNVLGGLREEGHVYLDVWFDDAEPVEMSEDVVGLGTYERTLTVIFPATATGGGSPWPQDDGDT